MGDKTKIAVWTVRTIILAICAAIVINSAIFMTNEVNGLKLEAPELQMSVENGVVHLKWNYIPGAKSYRILRNKNNEGWYVFHVNTSGSNVYNDYIPVNSETCCRYKIIAAHGTEDGFILSEASNICTYVENMQVPASIEATKAGSKSTDGITVSWTPSKTASGYHLYRIVNNTKLELVTAMAYTVTEYLDLNVQPNVKYSYKVRAINFWGEGDTLYSSFTSPSNNVMYEG